MKNNDVIKSVKKSLRIKVIILLGIMLTFNTLAWFIYSSTISNSIHTSVSAWKIEFENEDEIAEYIDFDLDDLYPGVPDYNNFINVVNYGETAAELSYKIISLRVLNTTYSDEDYTTEQLEAMLLNNYPFKISFSLAGTTIPPNNGSADFQINVNWPYESGDDEADTQWGHDSYSFKLANGAAKQIVISIKLIAKQINP